MHLHVILLFSVNLLYLLQPTITANAPTNETDRLALIKFKESITHDPHTMLSSWNDSMHFCNCLELHLHVADDTKESRLWTYKAISYEDPYHLTSATSPSLGLSVSKTTASMAKSHMKLVICSDCKRSILTITHWKVNYHPSYPIAPMLES